MTNQEALKILSVPEQATPDEIERQFTAMRTKIEEKIVKSPTPGLKERYRRALNELRTARDLLLTGSGGAELPLTRRGLSSTPASAAAIPSQPSVAPATPKPEPTTAAAPVSAAEGVGVGRMLLLGACIVALGAIAWAGISLAMEDRKIKRTELAMQAARDAVAPQTEQLRRDLAASLVARRSELRLAFTRLDGEIRRSKTQPTSAAIAKVRAAVETAQKISTDDPSASDLKAIDAAETELFALRKTLSP